MRPGTGCYIHTSGALSLGGESLVTGRSGERVGRVFDDWDGVGVLMGLLEDAPHRRVGRVVSGAGCDSQDGGCCACGSLWCWEGTG